LVDVSHACLIRKEDCGTTRKLVISAAGIRKSSFTKRLAGRFLAESIKDKKGNVVVKKGKIVDQEVIDLINKHKIEQVAVRSPLICQSKYGVCSKCYGLDMSTRKRVEVGVPVGVIAAQSIGEPGTQLTMRTKHVGGVVGLDVTQGLPRVQELLEVRTPKTLSPLAEFSGKAKVEETTDGFMVSIIGKKNNVKETATYMIPLTSGLRVKTGDLVVKGTQLASGSLDIGAVLRVRGIEEAQQYLLDEVQGVYESQGVGIHDKHFEVIIREMSGKVRVTSPGDSDFLVGSYVEKPIFDQENKKIKEAKGRPAKGKRIILGLIQSALHADSWLSSASFQQTANILTESSILGKEDNLVGLKENVIIGRLGPVDEKRARLEE